MDHEFLSAANDLLYDSITAYTLSPSDANREAALHELIHGTAWLHVPTKHALTVQDGSVAFADLELEVIPAKEHDLLAGSAYGTIRAMDELIRKHGHPLPPFSWVRAADYLQACTAGGVQLILLELGWTTTVTLHRMDRNPGTPFILTKHDPMEMLGRVVKSPPPPITRAERRTRLERRGGHQD
ncbi:MAG: hypothetical protein R2811_12070 [Flavobacteriales bacterium]